MFEKNAPIFDSHMTQIYAICTSYDSELNLLFSGLKIFDDSPTQIFKIHFLPKCVGGIKIRTWYSDLALNFTSNGMFEYRYISIFPALSVKMIIAWALLKKLVKSILDLCDPILTHTIRREIWRWIRRAGQNFDPTHAFLWKSFFVNLRRLAVESRPQNCSQYTYVHSVSYSKRIRCVPSCSRK